MTTNQVTIVLDPVPPANPTMFINDGAGISGTLVVNVELDSLDVPGGAGEGDVTSMKIWGDVDPLVDMNVQPLQGSSLWIAFVPTYLVQLNSTPGLHTLYAQLRDDVGNVTMPFSATIIFNPATPQVNVTAPLSVGRISATSPYDATAFGWQSTLAFQAYQIRVVPSENSSVNAGVPIGSGGGSTNVSGGAGPATTTITTTIRGTDLLTAAPGVGSKICKVFVQSLSGIWSV